MPAGEPSDADLVAESLAGDRDAFRHIVERHQNLVCSLVYSATGSLSLSEDLAQETFVAAWTQLPELRERSKLRSWLCGITRFLIGKELRRQGREPGHGADTLEAVSEAMASEPLPSEQVISQEESAILWRSLERIPEIYREPLVLFYREHQSIEHVAQALELSEDAIKQRLSRGRKLLQEQVLTFVESALQKTSPGRGFTVAVMAALPVLAATSAGAAVTMAAAKGSATGKSATGITALAAVLTGGAILLFSVLGFLVFMGSCFGYLMGRACLKSSRQLVCVTRFWRTTALGFFVFVIPALIAGYLGRGPAQVPRFYHALTFWVTLIYPLVLAALVIWLWQWKRESRQETVAAPAGGSLGKRLPFWLGAAMVVPAGICVVFLYSMISRGTFAGRRLSEVEAQRIVSTRSDATFSVEKGATGSDVLWIKLSENGKAVEFWTPASDATLALLAEKGISHPTRIEGRDYHFLGRAGRWLPLLSFFIVPMGAFVFLRRSGTGKSSTSEPAALKT